jgi:hypothetical protein
VTVTLVVGLSDSGPNAVHQIVVTFLAVMEAAVSLSEGVSFLTGGHQITLRGEAGYDGPYFSTSDEVARWFPVHGHNFL